MKILITGATGFFGCHVGKALSSIGHGLVLVDSREVASDDHVMQELLARDNVIFKKVNLVNDDLAFLRKLRLDCVIHLAAILGVENVLSDPLSTLDLNCTMLSRLVSALLGYIDDKRFIFASTSEVYAESVDQGLCVIPTPEDSKIVLPDLSSARSTYMLSKLFGECLVKQSSFNPVVIRPHNLYGPRMGMRHVVPQLISRIHQTPVDGQLEVYSPEHTRTFCYISDAVKQVVSLVEGELQKITDFNIGTMFPEIKIMGLAKQLTSLMNRNDIVLTPGPIAAGSPSRRCPDTSLIDRLMGDSRRVSLEEGLAKTIDFYSGNNE